MGLPASQQRILEAIQSDLRATDPVLFGLLLAFASVTRKAHMPAAEQLASDSLFRRSRRAGLILKREEGIHGRL